MTLVHVITHAPHLAPKLRANQPEPAPVYLPAQPAAEPLPEPTLADLATRLTFAAWRAAKAAIHGERIFVTGDEFAARGRACGACDLWNPGARGGLGKCGHQSCGCTRGKLWLATETCPLAKWPG